MRKTLAISFTIALGLVGCTQPYQATRSQQSQRPSLIDEYSLLDEQMSDKPLNDKAVQKKLEEARRHYIMAMRASEQKQTSIAVKHFESAIEILNDLMTYPDLASRPEFTRLSESLIRDYEEQVTSIDSLDLNSSFFVLRDKIFQEIETIPVERRKYPSRDQLAGVTGAPNVPTDLQIDMTDNTPVQQCITFFTSDRGRKFFSKWLERSGKYFPMYEKIFEEEGVPQELRYLSMIESGLNPSAVSWAKAVGLWQFIPSTGQMYGLTINWWIDERRDPEKATRAAARYLRDLYADLGDWHLALASYNCGPGRVKSAIAKAGSRDYWKVREYLPRETQQYVPLFIAASKITMDPDTYGFTNIDYEKPMDFGSVMIREEYDLASIASAIKVSPGDIKALNPELLRDQIPQGMRQYSLRIPTIAARNAEQRIAALPAPDHAKLVWKTHKVGRGESLTAIAQKYDVSVEDLCAANRMRPNGSLHRGTTLRVPTRESDGDTSNDSRNLADNSVSTPAAPPVMASVPVRTAPVSQKPEATPSTDTRPAAATGSRTSSSDRKDDRVSTPPATKPVVADKKNDRPAAKTLAARNDDTPTKKNKHGVTTTTSRFETHSVRRGESLIAIADRYGVAVEDLKAWNAKSVRGNTLLAGAKLKIYSEAPSKGDARRTSRVSKSAPKSYKVRRGETLQDISNKFGVSVADLKKNNPKISNKSLQAGQSLRIQK